MDEYEYARGQKLIVISENIENSNESCTVVANEDGIRGHD